MGIGFFDLDGCLVRTNLVHYLLHSALSSGPLGRRVARTSRVLASLPAYAILDRLDRQRFNRLLFSGYAGESHDRLRFLAEDLFDRVIEPAFFPRARGLVEGARRAGLRLVLLTGAPDFVAEAVARHLDLHDFGSNRLELINGVATGRLLPPVMALGAKAAWARRYAAKLNVPLSECHAFANDEADLALLSLVGHPTIVNGTKGLLRSPRTRGWPAVRLVG